MEKSCGFCIREIFPSLSPQKTPEKASKSSLSVGKAVETVENSANLGRHRLVEKSVILNLTKIDTQKRELSKLPKAIARLPLFSGLRIKTEVPMNEFDQTYLDTTERREDEPTATGRQGVSPAVIKRLPRYYRYLRELIRQDKLRISSSELSRMMHVTASQIRQDFNCFGGSASRAMATMLSICMSRSAKFWASTSIFTLSLSARATLAARWGGTPCLPNAAWCRRQCSTLTRR